MASEHDFLEQVFTAVEAGVALLSSDGEVVLANDAARRLLALPDTPTSLPASGTFFASPAGDPIPCDDLPWQRTVRDGRSRRGHRLHLCDAEGEREIVAGSLPLTSAEGDRIGVALTVRPTRAEDAYPAGEASAVLGQMPAGCMVLGLDGSLRYANEELRSMWGLGAPGPGETESLERFPVVRDDGRTAALTELPVGRAIRGERVDCEVLEIVRGDDSRGTLLVNAAPIRDRAGRTVAAAAMFIDITERALADRLNEAIIAIATALDSCLEPEDVLMRAVHAAGTTLKADAVALLEPHENGWRVAQAAGFEKARAGAVMHSDAVPVVARAFETGQPAAASDMRGIPGVERATHPDIGAVLAVPVRVRGERAAVLILSFRAPMSFTQVHLDFAQRLSHAISLALGNASLLTSMREELGHSRVLQEVAVVATSSPDLRVVCSRVLKALKRHLDLLTGDIRVISAEGDMLRLVAEIGYPGEMVERIRETPMDEESSVAALSIARRHPITHEDEAAVEKSKPLMADTHFEKMRYVVLPIDFRKHMVGTLALAFDGRRAFTEDEMGLFEAIAHTIGQAIESARLLDAEKRSRRQATAELEMTNLLLETAECLARPLEMRQVLDALAGSVQRVTGRARIIVMLYHPRTRELVVRAVRGVPPAIVGRKRTLDGYPEPMRDLERQEGARVVAMTGGQLDAEEAEARPERRVYGLIVPIRHRDRLIGAVTVDEPGEARPYTDRELRLVEGVVSQAAVTIENARSYEDEHRIAETLQETLLLMPEHVPGVQFGTLYRSATAAARVGGDFYDVFEVGDDKVALVVGDVSGKGLDAASVTALARNAFRIHASEGLPPDVVLGKTNDVLRRFTSSETFVTAFFGVLHTSTGAFHYVCAGHPDGMVVGRGGYVRRLAGESPLLGALEGVTFGEEVTMVAPTDTIFLYTDGVTEARRGLDFYGVSRLAEFLATQSDNDPHRLPGIVFREVEAFAGGELRDDVAMLAVRRMG